MSFCHFLSKISKILQAIKTCHNLLILLPMVPTNVKIERRSPFFPNLISPFPSSGLHSDTVFSPNLSKFPLTPISPDPSPYPIKLSQLNLSLGRCRNSDNDEDVMWMLVGQIENGCLRAWYWWWWWRGRKMASNDWCPCFSCTLPPQPNPTVLVMWEEKPIWKTKNIYRVILTVYMYILWAHITCCLGWQITWL